MAEKNSTGESLPLWVKQYLKTPKAFAGKPHWIKVEMVKISGCSVGWKQGDAIYFTGGGRLITRKAKNPHVCSHALASLSPALYTCVDRLGRGEDPRDIVIDHVNCTDPGVEHKGLGNNTMRITYEPIPLQQRFLDKLHALSNQFFPKPAPITPVELIPVKPIYIESPDSDSSQKATSFLEKCSLTKAEIDEFIKSERRVRRISGIESNKNLKVKVEVVKSDACIAQHRVGDKFYFDSMGCLLTDGVSKPICSRLLHRIWWRLIMINDRVSENTESALNNDSFTEELLEVKMSCYGAEFPFGDCGHIIMGISIER